METIDRERLEEVMLACLYQDDEIEDPSVVPEGAIIVEGLTTSFGFHPGRVAQHADEIRAMVAKLAEEFHSGGGWSFLNMCTDGDGNQWTDFHRDQEHLTVLGIAAGHMKYCLPRELWSALPGGMPYVRAVEEAATTSGD